MEDSPIKSLDIQASSSIPTSSVLPEAGTPESPIPRRKKPVSEPEPTLSTKGNGTNTNGHVTNPAGAEVLQNGNINGVKKRTASDALDIDVSPTTKRFKALSSSDGSSVTVMDNSIIILDDANDGAIMIDDD